jgi:16S rRNA (adenine1518-N6/adenine1519-N6)-dimethyltransferase
MGDKNNMEDNMDEISGHRNLDATGQHYMIDKALIKFIVDEAALSKTDVVLEIGHGHGELTKELIKKCYVIAIDIEHNLGIKSPMLKILKGNILEHIGGISFTKIVSNIPYNISEPLFRKLFKKDLDLCILTMGKNFSEILMQKNNRIGILANHFYDMEILKVVKPKSFFPHPRNDSVIIRIEPKNIDELDKLGALYKELLMLDNKKLKNALEKIIGKHIKLTKKSLNDAIKSHKMENIFEKRIYQLSNEEFVGLDGFLKKIAS